MGGTVTLLKIFLLLIVLCSLLFLLSADMRGWCETGGDQFKDQWTRFGNYVRDTSSNVTEEHRKPPMSIKDYYVQRDEILLHQQIKTGTRFSTQQSMGSVLTDGFHDEMPPHSKWEGGVIKIGSLVAEEIKRATAPRKTPATSQAPPTEQKPKDLK
jgi:hypothetical protein